MLGVSAAITFFWIPPTPFLGEHPTVLLQLDRNVDKNRLRTLFPMALHFAEYWIDHAKYEDVALRVQHAMERLFDTGKPYFAAWAGIYKEN